MNSTTLDLSPIQSAVQKREAEEQRRRDALIDLLGESDIQVSLLDGNTVYVNIGCAELLYTSGYSIRNGSLFQNEK